MFKKIIFIGLFLSSIFSREIDLNDLITKATKSHKTLFLFIHTTDCGYCESMREFTLDDDNIKAKLKANFIYEHINVKDEDSILYQDFRGSGLAFAKATGYNLYPSSLFFGEDTNLIYALPGYQDEKRFNKILDFITSKSYLKMHFHKYEKMKNNHDK
jgi:thioredoxin-related protein